MRGRLGAVCISPMMAKAGTGEPVRGRQPSGWCVATQRYRRGWRRSCQPRSPPLCRQPASGTTITAEQPRSLAGRAILGEIPVVWACSAAADRRPCPLIGYRRSNRDPAGDFVGGAAHESSQSTSPTTTTPRPPTSRRRPSLATSSTNPAVAAGGTLPAARHSRRLTPAHTSTADAVWTRIRQGG